MSSYKLDNEKLEKIKADLINSQKSLEEMLEKKNKLAILDMEKSNIITESGHFKKYNIPILRVATNDPEEESTVKLLKERIE